MSALLITRTALRHATRAVLRPTFAEYRSLMTLRDKKYTAHATARGQGRNGQVKSHDDAGLDLRLAMPKSLGGKGDGQNPEQLFAMGYAACFLSALQMVAGRTGKVDMARNATVHAQVHIGEPEGGEGFALQVDIQVEGVDDIDLIEAGHKYFSKATAEGSGRNGFVRSWGDSPLELKMSLPRTAGGKGDGQNPEQLFAMGYASCFLGALQLAAARANKKELAENAKVTAHVFLGHPMDPNLDGFRLRVELAVEGCSEDAIIAEAHQFCPYSRALCGGAQVTISKG
ncbi:hypothetical protein V8D89_011774 [Ganoderma adspersum]